MTADPGTTPSVASAALKRLLIVGALVAVGSYGAYYFDLIPGLKHQAAAVPTAFELPSAGEAKMSVVVATPLPNVKPATPNGVNHVKISIWAWNAQMGLIFANGGPVTTQGSLMEKHNVNLTLERQDDTEKTKAAQLKFAQSLSAGNPNPTEGAHFAIIMGDGAAQYLAAINDKLKKLGNDYHAEIVGAVGYSRGEDGWWGPEEWKSPEAMKGGATAGVLRDGDWNIAQFKLANNGIKNNPDETTYDPDAMNWFSADDYLKAVEMYITGYCEDRPVVRDGKLTHEPKHHTCVQAYVTWTPGDVNGAKKKGGLTRLLSTKENIYQMPAVLIGIHRWDAAHSKLVQDLLAAALEGGDQVKSFEPALSRAGQASYAVYAEESPAYWVKYYKGTIERDKTQQPVPLGGSTTMNLADNALLFGLTEGSGGLDGSLFKATYEGFGNIVVQQYPRLMPSFPKTSEAVDTTYLEALLTKYSPAVAEAEHFEDTGSTTAKENVVASKNWSIQFNTGKSSFTPAAQATLEQLYSQVVVGGALTVEVDGHTDNVGNSDANLVLSMARAQAVKTWLEQRAPLLFPANRVTVNAYGDTKPLVSNETADGRAKNRRVTVVLGSR